MLLLQGSRNVLVLSARRRRSMRAMKLNWQPSFAQTNGHAGEEGRREQEDQDHDPSAAAKSTLAC